MDYANLRRADHPRPRPLLPPSPSMALIRKQCLAELAGTFFLLLIGISANIQATCATTSSASDPALLPPPLSAFSQSAASAAQLGAHIAWGLGLAFGVCLSAQISGGHLNPAISLVQFSYGHISARQFVLYLPAQLAGAFLGSAFAFIGHFEDSANIRSFLGEHSLAANFATFPRDGLSTWGSVADQLLGTAILAICICAITDPRHRIPPSLVPPLAGLSLTTIALSFGSNAGFAINPARDLGPRLFLLCVGLQTFSTHQFYFWVPLLIPFLGAMAGAFGYKKMIGERSEEATTELGMDSAVNDNQWQPNMNAYEDPNSAQLIGKSVVPNYGSTSSEGRQ